jgi:hypothetical protein
VDGGLAVLELIGEPFGGAAQVVVAGLEELGCGLGVFGDRGEEEALLGQVAVVRGLEALQAGAGSLATPSVAGADGRSGESGSPASIEMSFMTAAQTRNWMGHA